MIIRVNDLYINGVSIVDDHGLRARPDIQTEENERVLV